MGDKVQGVADAADTHLGDIELIPLKIDELNQRVQCLRRQRDLVFRWVVARQTG